MKIKIPDKLAGLYILAILISIPICCVVIQTDLYHRNPTLSNTYLCKKANNECLLLGNNVFVSEDFNNIQICTTYSSSQPESLQIFLVYQVDGPFIGMLFDDIDKGDFEICYLLKDVVERLESTNLGGKYPSPVHDGVIDEGSYRVIFERGRTTLAELKFEVVEKD